VSCASRCLVEENLTSGAEIVAYLLFSSIAIAGDQSWLAQFTFFLKVLSQSVSKNLS
jgi:hypothetical protein